MREKTRTLPIELSLEEKLLISYSIMGKSFLLRFPGLSRRPLRGNHRRLLITTRQLQKSTKKTKRKRLRKNKHKRYIFNQIKFNFIK